MSYIPPIKLSTTELVSKEIVKEQEKNIIKLICSYNIDINKEELIKAIQYDRNQYENGCRDMKERILTNLKRKRNDIFEMSKKYNNKTDKDYFLSTVDTYDEIIRNIERFKED